MTREDGKQAPQARLAAADVRRRRLAAELRENLKRRKVQARARRTGAPEGDAASGPHETKAGDERER